MTASRAGTPNLFVVGAPKCATTSLHYALARHPDVFMSRWKEPHFLSALEPQGRYRGIVPVVRTHREYLELFAGGERCKLRGESSTSYLWSEKAAERIAREFPDSTVVAVIRNPIDRAESHYLHDLRDGLETRTFLEAVHDEWENGPRWGEGPVYLAAGDYIPGLRRYSELLGPDRVTTLMYDDVAADFSAVISELCEELGIDAEPILVGGPEVRNEFSVGRNAVARGLLTSRLIRRVSRRTLPRRVRAQLRRAMLSAPLSKPAMDPAARAILEEYFKGQSAGLEDLLGRPIPWST